MPQVILNESAAGFCEGARDATELLSVESAMRR